MIVSTGAEPGLFLRNLGDCEKEASLDSFWNSWGTMWRRAEPGLFLR